MNKQFSSIILAIALILNTLTFPLAAQICDPQVDDYSIKDNVNMDISRIEMGESCNLSIDILDKKIKTNEISSEDNISVISVDGSFGSIDADSVTITSKDSEELKYTIKFEDATYTGVGNAITFKIRYKDFNLTSTGITARINECSEKETDNSTTEEVYNQQPFIEISRANIPTPIKAEQEFDVQLIIKNRGNVEIKKPYLTLSLPSSIASREGMGNISIPNIKSGGSAKVTIKLQAEDYIESISEEIDVLLNFNYDSGSSGITTGSYSDRIFIPMEATKKGNTPIIQILRGNVSSNIKAEQEFTLPVTIKNIGQTDIFSPVISFSLPEELMFTKDSSTVALNDLKAGEEIQLTLNLKTKKQLTSSTQDISAELKYNYKSANEAVQGTESAKLVIPVISNTDEGSEPLLQIITSDLQPVKNNQSFSTIVVINNIGSTAVKNGVLTWQADDNVIITGKTGSVNIGAIKAGESKNVKISAKTLDKISSTSLTINGELKYTYDNGKNLAQGTETVKLVVPAQPNTTDSVKKTTPNIIVDSYNYGGTPIANGDKFNLNVNFKNTGKDTAVENIVMTVETGDGVSISSASNTYFYEKLAPLAAKNQNIEMQVHPLAESGSVKLDINFKYEYVDNGERSQVTSTQSVSIPVYKPDKLEISLDPIPPAYVNTEQTITLNYVNKGKGELSNVKAEINGEISALTSVQNLGNFESGKSGTINFVVVPDTLGEINFSILISYEDANLEQKTLEFPCVIYVEEDISNDMDFYEEPIEEEEATGIGVWGIIGIVIGVIAVITIVIIILKKHKKKKEMNLVKVSWEAEDENMGLD